MLVHCLYVHMFETEFIVMGCLKRSLQIDHVGPLLKCVICSKCLLMLVQLVCAPGSILYLFLYVSFTRCSQINHVGTVLRFFTCVETYELWLNCHMCCHVRNSIHVHEFHVRFVYRSTTLDH